MNEDLTQSSFSKGVITGLFVGLFATIVCCMFNIIYRDETSFALSNIINVSSLIFVVNIIFLVIGMLYIFFIQRFKSGKIIFIALFTLITIFLALKSEGVNRSVNPVLSQEFRGLLLGVVLILGASAAFLVPFLYGNKQFEKYVL
jgi:drug/metabolite transporter (DMT)-like permease